jgi:predicted Zn-dependent protease
LGLAQALIEGESIEEALVILNEEQKNSNAEISTQSFIAQAQLHLREEEPQKTIEILWDIQAQSLGPAWDATLEETRATAYISVQDPEKAKSILRALAERWPTEEEALLPALLGLADIHRGQKETKEALIFAQKALDSATDDNYRERAKTFIEELSP